MLTIPGVSITTKELRWLLFSATRAGCGKLRLIPHILFSTDSGKLPRLHRALQALPKLLHYPRCVFDYAKNDRAIFSCHRSGTSRLLSFQYSHRSTITSITSVQFKQNNFKKSSISCKGSRELHPGEGAFGNIGFSGGGGSNPPRERKFFWGGWDCHPVVFRGGGAVEIYIMMVTRMTFFRGYV